jgi:hypothetical protein
VTERRKSPNEREEVVERLREFIRFNYTTGAEVARQIGVRDSTVYSWLSGESRPTNPERIATFLDSMPAESGAGTGPTGYEYREYKNWRGIVRRQLFLDGSDSYNSLV